MSDFLNKSFQLTDFEEVDLKFQTPCSICVSGPSQSGKSQWILKLIKNRDLLFTERFHELYYCIPENVSHNPNPIFEEIKKSYPSARICYGLPDVTKLNLNFDNTSKLLIIDDLMTEFLASFKWGRTNIIQDVEKTRKLEIWARTQTRVEADLVSL